MNVPPQRTVAGVVVGHVDLGEADRIVRLLTPAEGRVDALARGARTSRRRFGAALEPGTRVVLTLTQGRGSLPTIADVEVVQLARRPREDLDRLLLLHHGCEVTSHLSEAGASMERELGLLEVWLDLLEGDPAPGERARLAFEAKALTFAGLAPSLRRCARCGEPLDDPARFDLEAGGGVHARCGEGVAVLADDLRELDVDRRAPLAEVVARADGATVPPSLRWALCAFIEAQTRRPLKARRMWMEGLS